MAHGNAEKNQCKLAVMFTLNFSFFLVELVVGYLTRSMALVADSFHMLSDVAALVVAFFAVRMSPKKWSRNTYGFARAEVLGALVNSVFLLALCFSITIDSIKRIIRPEQLENPPLILIVGTIGLVMNLVGLCIFRDHGHSHGHGHSHSHDPSTAPLERKRSTMVHQNRLTHMMRASAGADDEIDSPGTLPLNHHHAIRVEPSDEQVNQNDDKTIRFKSKPSSKKGGGADQMNIRGVFLHLLADALGSVIVLVSALVVWLTSWEYKDYVDPCMSIAMVILITCSSLPLLVESSMILLQSVPEHIDIGEIEKKLLRQIDGVIGVHELHVWQLTGDTIIATAHIKCTNIEEYFEIAEKVKAVFHNEGIHSTTIQPEFSQQSPLPGIKDDTTDCFLSCAALSATSNCAANTCCKPTPDRGLVENSGATRKARQ